MAVWVVIMVQVFVFYFIFLCGCGWKRRQQGSGCQMLLLTDNTLKLDFIYCFKLQWRPRIFQRQNLKPSSLSHFARKWEKRRSDLSKLQRDFHSFFFGCFLPCIPISSKMILQCFNNVDVWMLLLDLLPLQSSISKERLKDLQKGWRIIAQDHPLIFLFKIMACSRPLSWRFWHCSKQISTSQNSYLL